MTKQEAEVIDRLHAVLYDVSQAAWDEPYEARAAKLAAYHLSTALTSLRRLDDPEEALEQIWDAEQEIKPYVKGGGRGGPG